MPPSRSQHDPFTTTSNAAGPSLRTNASAAPTRTRQQLFAPALSRRPTSRTAARAEDDVLPDSDSEQENVTAHRQRQQHRRIRHGSPEGRHPRLKPKQQPQAHVEEPDIVNRQPDGTYLLGGSGVGLPTVPTVFGQDVAEASDHMDAAIARRYFASGHHLNTRASSRHAEDEFERERPDLQLRLREQILSRLEDAKWMYEPVDRYQPTGIS